MKYNRLTICSELDPSERSGGEPDKQRVHMENKLGEETSKNDGGASVEDDGAGPDDEGCR